MNVDLFFRLVRSGPVSQLSFPIMIRWFLVAGGWLRLFLTFDQYAASDQQRWILALLALTAYAFWITFQGLRNPTLKGSKKWHLFQVLAETIIFSILFWLTKSPDSDLFLFYFSPILIAAENFRSREAFCLFLIISLAFTVVAVQLSPPLRDGTFIAETLVRNVLPRGLFFLFILFLAFARGNRLREQAEELEALHITAIKIANNEDLHSRLEAIMDVATGLLGAKGCKVFLRVVDQKRLELVAVKGVKSDVLKPGYVLPVGTGLAGEVISRKSPMITNDYPNCQYRVPELANLFGAVIEVPLLFKGEAIGVLAVFDDAQPSRFTEQDIPILVRLAQHAAIAIHDIDLVEQVQRQKEALQALNIAGDAMTANLDVNNTLNSVVKHAWELSLVYNEDPPLFACVSLLDEKAQYLQFEAAYPEEQKTFWCRW
jgi:hypothetical protein